MGRENSNCRGREENRHDTSRKMSSPRQADLRRVHAVQWSAQEPGCLPLTPVTLLISLILGKALVYSVPNFLICEMELLVLPTLGSCWGIS